MRNDIDCTIEFVGVKNNLQTEEGNTVMLEHRE